MLLFAFHLYDDSGVQSNRVDTVDESASGATKMAPGRFTVAASCTNLPAAVSTI